MDDIDNYDFNPDSYCPEDFPEPVICPERAFRQFKDKHLTFREQACDAAEKWDLRQTLYNFYQFCISGYANDGLYLYAKFKAVFNKAAWIDFNGMEYDAESMESLKKMVMYLFDTDPDCNRWFSIFHNLDWQPDDLFNRYHKTVTDALQLLNNNPETQIRPLRKPFVPYLQSVYDEIYRSIEAYKLPETAYWCCVLSVATDCGWLDNSWWDNLWRMSRSDLYEYLCRRPFKASALAGETRAIVQETVNLAIGYMKPFVKINKL